MTHLQRAATHNWKVSFDPTEMPYKRYKPHVTSNNNKRFLDNWPIKYFYAPNTIIDGILTNPLERKMKKNHVFALVSAISNLSKTQITWWLLKSGR